MVWLLTFTCYGARLQGSPRGWVDRDHNRPGAPLLAGDVRRSEQNRGLMPGPAVTLNGPRRAAVLAGIRHGCAQREWDLLAAHVRTNHVHLVVSAEGEAPEAVLSSLKAYATRELAQQGVHPPGERCWTRHGSTRRLSSAEAVTDALRYVLERQGRPMAVYVKRFAR